MLNAMNNVVPYNGQGESDARSSTNSENSATFPSILTEFDLIITYLNTIENSLSCVQSLALHKLLKTSILFKQNIANKKYFESLDSYAILKNWRHYMCDDSWNTLRTKQWTKYTKALSLVSCNAIYCCSVST